MKRLGEFAADGTPADDAQASRAFGQVKHSLVGQITCLVEPRRRRRSGASTGGNDGFGKTQCFASDFNRAGSGELSRTQKHVHPQLRKTVDAIIAANVGPQPPHAGHDGAKIYLSVATDMNAIAAGVTHVGPGGGAPDEALTRYTAIVQTIAAHQVFFDQCDSGA